MVGPRANHQSLNPCSGYSSVKNVCFLFCFFLPFLGLLSQHMEVPRLGVCLIRAEATGLRQSHSNARSELRLQPTPQFRATIDP